jgi:hypothetical protein
MANIARTSGSTFTSTTASEFIGKDLTWLAIVIKNNCDAAQSISGEDLAEELVDTLTQIITTGDSSYNYGANILALQQNATGQISLCLEGATGWTATALRNAIRAYGTINSIDVSGTTVTDVGFKLALS